MYTLDIKPITCNIITIRIQHNTVKYDFDSYFGFTKCESTALTSLIAAYR
jgi:hypothetical protein